MTPWRLVTLVDADASDMGLISTNRTLARLRGAVNVRARSAAAEDSRSISRCDTVRLVAYKVQLIYFRQTGTFLAAAETTVAGEAISEIWKEVDSMRRLGALPGLRPGAGRDLFIVVDVPDHPQRVLHLVMAPFLDEDDVTPPRTSTSEMLPLVRVPLDEIPRTTTRDVVKLPLADLDADTFVVPDDDVTPVDRPMPKLSDEPPDEPPDGDDR
jgi:hypothetical protein